MDAGDPGSGWMGSTRDGVQRLRKGVDERAGRSPRPGNGAREVREGRAETGEPTGGECASQAGGTEGLP